MLARKDSPVEVQREAIAGLVRLHQMSLAGSELATKAVGKAARNYAAHPEELWPQLMLAAARLDAVKDLAALLSQAEKAAAQEQTVERLRTVRSVAALDEVPARKLLPSENTTGGLRRLSECSTEELLAMAQRRVDSLAANSAPDRAWGELAAIMQEYARRSRQAG